MEVADGKLHDYMFPWVNGFAIYEGWCHEQAKTILKTVARENGTVSLSPARLAPAPRRSRSHSPTETCNRAACHRRLPSCSTPVAELKKS